ncbi:MAG: hypothetical protein FWC47_05250 [Oscillospiraceae bacterium]|nr:hypothetical protein [Oscillospiraceae bacterium]
MIISIPDKFLIELEHEKYFIRNDLNNKRKYLNLIKEIDEEYINFIYSKK